MPSGRQLIVLFATLIVALSARAWADKSSPSTEASHQPKKVALLFGANGDNVGFERIFYDLMSPLQKKGWGLRLSAGPHLANWDTDPKDDEWPVSLDGREERKAVLRRSGGTREELLKELSVSIDSLGSDDELFISFLTHGRPAGESGYSSHLIRTNDPAPNSLMAVDDPELVALLQKAKEKKIRLGFYDLSCFSGGSITALSKFGCVVTSQSSDNPTIVFPDARITKNVGMAIESHGSTLGDVFLKTLFSDKSNQPQIAGLSFEGFPEHYFRLKIRETFITERACRASKAIDQISSLLNILNGIRMASYLQEINEKGKTAYKDVNEIITEAQSSLLSLSTLSTQYDALANEFKKNINVYSVMDGIREKLLKLQDQMAVLNLRSKIAMRALRGLAYLEERDRLLNSQGNLSAEDGAKREMYKECSDFRF